MAIRPVWATPSTSTNRPATRGSTDQETPFSTGRGEARLRISTTRVVRTPRMAVGRPSCRFSDDTTSSVTAVTPMPARAVQAPGVMGGCWTRPAQAPPSRSRSTQRRAAQVARIAAADGRAKRFSQSSSGGVWAA